MLKFNLLPPEQKRELSWQQLYGQVVSFSIWVFASLGVFVLVLAVAYFSLKILLSSQKDLISTMQQSEKAQALSEVESKIKQANKNLEKIYNKQSEWVSWTPLLMELSRITPSSVELTRFSFSMDGGVIKMGGEAATRDALLVFEDNLKKSDFFGDIKSPLANVIKKQTYLLVLK